MTRQLIDSPGPDEYDDFYEGYVTTARVRDPFILLHQQVATLRASLGGLTEAESLYRYAPGKWSVKQVVGHLTDTERVFSYRLLRICRGDRTPLSGFDQDMYVAAGSFDDYPLPSLLAEFEAVRLSTIRLAEGISPEAWKFRGIVNDSPVSARALLFIIVGHVDHHLNMLHERHGIAIASMPAMT